MPATRLPRGIPRIVILRISVPAVLVGVVIFVIMRPDQTEKLAGWVWRGLAYVVRIADRKAVAFSVQGDVNSACAALMKDVPEGLLGGKLKLEWASAEQARARIRDGEVVVFMRRSRDREENITNALMTYLPRAIIPRARPYIDRETMRAVDLTIARSILALSHMPSGTLDVFFEHHLNPALAELRNKLNEIDAIDLHGWLTRVMLSEYRRLGDKLYPSPCDDACLHDAREFCTWLAKLARREAYDHTTPLKYKGRYLNAGIVLVAMKGRIDLEGLVPYRKRAKRLIYREKCDVVYLMARDENIAAVHELREDLIHDALVEEVTTYEYPLRSDFAARLIYRERAIIVMLRRRRVVERQPPGDEADMQDALSEEIEIYDASQAPTASI
jgi:hypothetical protein